MYTQQTLSNEEEIEKLRIKNAELKKELDREQHLHSMLYKEWKKQSDKIASMEQQVYEDSKPKNLFYKYAFYVLIIALIPVTYFLYPHIISGTKVPASPQLVADSVFTKDTIAAISTTSLKDSVNKKDVTTAKLKSLDNKDAIQQTAVVTPPVIKPAEKKIILPDSNKHVTIPVRKPIAETPLTDDARDSISSLGFSAYFDHHRNPFRRSSEKYKAWDQGWNEGKEEARKVAAKDPSLR